MKDIGIYIIYVIYICKCFLVSVWRVSSLPLFLTEPYFFFLSHKNIKLLLKSSSTATYPVKAD